MRRLSWRKWQNITRIAAWLSTSQSCGNHPFPIGSVRELQKHERQHAQVWKTSIWFPWRPVFSDIQISSLWIGKGCKTWFDFSTAENCLLWVLRDIFRTRNRPSAMTVWCALIVLIISRPPWFYEKEATFPFLGLGERSGGSKLGAPWTL